MIITSVKKIKCTFYKVTICWYQQAYSLYDAGSYKYKVHLIFLYNSIELSYKNKKNTYNKRKLY